jgi:bacillithiol system protein YtxJ
VTDFRPLTTSEDLDAVFRASHDEPVILFKHSQTCGTSWMAREDLETGLLPAPVHEVLVQRHRPVSDALAATLGLRHESPQIVVVSGGKAVWHSSHAGVTAERVARAWRTAAIATPTLSADSR